MNEGRQAQLAEFVSYAKSLKGDEKGEAQVFLDRLFRAFSRAGYKEAGATLEDRVKKTDGGTAFADLVWKPVVLIEMKKRGADLSRHLTQAFDYWVQLVPNRPRYVVLCNFDEFRIYDFNLDINEPQDTITLAELPTRYDPLNFLWPTNELPKFKIDREKATREAADLLANVYRCLKTRKDIGPEKAQRFALQSLVCLFAEDIDLLPRHFFTNLLDECTDPPKSFDLLDGLFRAMNARGGTKSGRYKPVPFFNGGIFAHSSAVELDPQQELVLLKKAATYQWAHVSPDIFGTIFQHSMDATERHALGAHYTAQADIMRIVGPTIVQPFTTALAKANTLRDLAALKSRLQSLRVLDPACGSGNFLYIAYREMRRLEAMISAKEDEISKRGSTGQIVLGGVSPRQFFGMDIIPFAVELAKVTLSLAPKLSSDELHTTEATLPLDNLDQNITVKDALIDEKQAKTVWPAADVIIGNPPFLGAKKLKPERGVDYIRKLRKAYPELPGMADYCVYWIRRSHDHLAAASPADPFAGRAGLVGTQNIRNNQSRVGGLDYVVKSGVIVEAVENLPWSGEANVHVSIANWVKAPGKPNELELLIPSQRRLWSEVDPKLARTESTSGASSSGAVTKGKRGKVRQSKSYEMAVRLCDEINSALSDDTDLSSKRSLDCNKQPKCCFQGKIPGYNGFMLDAREAKQLGDKSKAVVKPYLIGRELLDEFKVERWAIDFEDMGMLEARKFAEAFQHCERAVLPDVKQSVVDADSDSKDSRKEHLERWWQFWNRRDQLNAVFRRLPRVVACSRVTRRPIVAFISTKFCPGDLIQMFAFEDDYSFGVLQASPHFEWFRKSSRMKVETDSRYSVREVFDTFPWPQSPTKKQVKSVAVAGREIRAIRDKAAVTIKGGLRALYRTLELPGKNTLKDAHAALDAAVLDAYGFSAKKDLLKQLLDLNLQVAKAIERGDPVTAPGVPLSYGNPADLITDDCIRP